MVQPNPEVTPGTMVLPGRVAGTARGSGLGPSRLAEACERRVRAEVARELHDRVAHPLTALLLDLEQLRRDPGDRRRLLRRIEAAQDQVRSALFGLREVLCELRDQEWLDGGLTARLRGELESVKLRHPHLDVRLRVSRRWPAVVPSRVADHLLRVVVEAVHNARLHGGASRIEVSLAGAGRRAGVVVSDDGRGLEGRRLRPGMGLLGIHERATLLGGRLIVDDRPGGGTRVRVSVPREVLG